MEQDVVYKNKLGEKRERERESDFLIKATVTLNQIVKPT